MFSLRSPTRADIERVHADQSRAALTYTDVGATRNELPAGYRHDRHTIDLGTGDDVWVRARDGLRTWQAHRAVGIRLWPDPPPLEEGTTVVQVISLGPVHTIACCRIVYVLDDEHEFGFAYGTLPAHPEEGEETFVARREGDGRVRFDVTVFSRPHELLARIGAPVTRAVQLSVARRYLSGLRAYCAQV